jgi:hypothetical protein
MVAVLAMLMAPLHVRAQSAGDEGDAPDVEATRPAGALARVAVIVLGKDGEPLPAATRATLQVSLERALEEDRRLEVVDQDVELARRAGQVPVETVSEARGLVRTGAELLRRGQTAQALAKLEAASAHLAEVLAWTQKQELAEAQFLLGAAQAIGGDRKAAVATFIALLAWRPQYVADPSIEPGTVMPLFEKAQARAAKLKGGSIDIASTPEGAMAYVDGRFVGFTPTVVEGLPAAVHYVTVRMHGRVRAVTAVKVSDRHGESLKVVLQRTPGVEELEAAVGGMAAGVGKEQAPAAVQAAFGEIADLLDVEHAVVLVAPEGGEEYAGYVYAVVGGTMLAKADVKMGDRDPADAFGELARRLYEQVEFEPRPEPVFVEAPKGRAAQPYYKKWWFWSAVGATVAAGLALPLILGRDRGPEIGCPSGDSCGAVILRF